MLQYASRWKELGEQLNVSMACLDTIQHDHYNHPRPSEKCCTEMLRRWMQSTSKPTWDEIRKAIDNLPLVSHDRPAKSKEIFFLCVILVVIFTNFKLFSK